MSQKKWLVLVYLAGDNSLSDDMAQATAKLHTIAGTLHNNAVMLYYDTAAPQVDTMMTDLTVYAGGPNSQVRLPDPPAGATPNPDIHSIDSFVKWAFQRLQTSGDTVENVALILSGHGDGFQQSSLLGDENPPSWATVPDLAAKIQDLAQLTPNGKFDLLGLESCAMSSIDIALEFSYGASMLVASEGDTPNAGWSFGHLVNWLSARDSTNPDFTAEQLGEELIDGYIDAYTEAAKVSDISIDLARVDLRGAHLAAEAVNALGSTLAYVLNSHDPFGIVLGAIRNAQRECQGYVVEQYVDIIDFLGILKNALRFQTSFLMPLGTTADTEVAFANIQNNPAQHFQAIGITLASLAEVTSKVDAILTKLNGILLSKQAGAKYQYSNGLSVYLPWSEVSRAILQNKNMTFKFGQDPADDNKPSGWLKFLEVYLSKSLRPPRRITVVHPKGGGSGKPRGGGSGKPRGDSIGILDSFCRFKNHPIDW